MLLAGVRLKALGPCLGTMLRLQTLKAVSAPCYALSVALPVHGHLHEPSRLVYEEGLTCSGSAGTASGGCSVGTPGVLRPDCPFSISQSLSEADEVAAASWACSTYLHISLRLQGPHQEQGSHQRWAGQPELTDGGLCVGVQVASQLQLPAHVPNFSMQQHLRTSMPCCSKPGRIQRMVKASTPRAHAACLLRPASPAHPRAPAGLA